MNGIQFGESFFCPMPNICFALSTFEKKFHVASAYECASGHLHVSTWVEDLLSGCILFPWAPGTAGKASHWI